VLGGDTDTLACMLGACLGALHGCSWIPQRWLQCLEQSAEYGVPRALELGSALASVTPSMDQPLADSSTVTQACDELLSRMRDMPLHTRHQLS
jgi:hypothetical protein